MPTIAGDGRLDKRLLIIDGERRHRTWLSRIARSVVSSVDLCEDPSSSFDPMAYDLVIIDRDGLDPEHRTRVLGALRESRAERGLPHSLIISSAANGYKELFQEFETYGLTNLLARNERVDAVELIVTMQKILQGDIFGLEKYFPWGVPTRSRIVRSSAERPEVLDEAEAYTRNLGVPPRLVEKFCTVVDELVTNALFDAPVDREGRPLYAHLSRTSEVFLEPGTEAVVKLCCDAHHLGVSVEDGFGALDVGQCVRHLVRCFRKDEDQLEQKEGGAGLGLYFSFDAVSHMAVNLAEGQRTEAIGLIDIRGSHRDFVSRSKSLNLFVETSSRAR